MPASLRALVAGVVDYAGTFPPARLPFAEALANYVRYQQSPDAWLLGSFVVAAAHLPEFVSLLPTHAPSPQPLPLALLGRGGDEPPAWLAHLREDLQSAWAAREAPGAASFHLAALEVKLPKALLSPRLDKPRLAQLLDEAARTASAAGLEKFALFLEAPLDCWCATAVAVARWRDAQPSAPFTLGMKVRTGGLTPPEIPSCEQLAAVIDMAQTCALPWKATAGLHHAVRGRHADLAAPMHGFLNLLMAAALAADFNRAQLAELLRDEDPAHFTFDDRAAHWHWYSAPEPHIRAIRQNQFVSFGSCSFDEPRGELAAFAP